MNSNKYLDNLNSLFETSGSPSQDAVLGLMDETMAFLREIKAQLESNDPEKQRQAFEKTMEMKRLLEAKMQALCEKTGLDPSQLAALASDPRNLRPEEREMLEAAKAKFDQFNEPITNKTIG